MCCPQLNSAMITPHLAWKYHRPTSELGGARLTQPYGLNPFLGPSGSALTHPVEALTVTASYLSSWRIIACLDYLLAHRIQVAERIWLKPFDREEIVRALSLLPPRSRSAERIARLLSQAVERTWSSAQHESAGDAGRQGTLSGPRLAPADSPDPVRGGTAWSAAPRDPAPTYFCQIFDNFLVTVDTFFYTTGDASHDHQ